MKGIVFNLLERLVSREYGEDAWDNLLEAAGHDGVYTTLGSYHDIELHQLVRAAARVLDTPPDAFVRWFGRNALPLLGESFREFFLGHTHTLPFLLTLNDIIHPEVRKLYPGADLPIFDFTVGEDGVLLIGYRSSRRLCEFGKGMVEGAANYYGERVTINDIHCMNRGDESCLFEIVFAKAQEPR